MSHSFSISYVKELESFLDLNVEILKSKIAEHAEKGEAFDLKKVIHFYVIDVLGELAFSQSFDVQVSGDESRVPPVVEHSLLAAATGAWPRMTTRLKRWLPKIPLRGLQRLFEGRAACARLASQCVQRRLSALNSAVEKDGGEVVTAGERKDILTNLVLAKHPDTGERLTQTDLETEAFGFMWVVSGSLLCPGSDWSPANTILSIAGTHTTSATTSLLFYHLLHAPEELAKCVAEVDENLTPLCDDRPAYSVSEVEASLPYLRL